MADAPQTKRFLISGATIFSKAKHSAIADFAKIAGLAAAVTVVAATETAYHKTQKTGVDVATVSAINKAVTFKSQGGVPKILYDASRTSHRATIAASVNVRDVTSVVDAVNRLRLDELNDEDVYHQYGDYKVSHSVLKDLVRAARDADFPTEYLFGIVEKESRFDCNAKPPSGSARGCMQVIEQTWLRLVKDYGPRYGLTEKAEKVQLSYNKRKQPVYKVSDPHEAQQILDLRFDVYYAASLAITDLKSAKTKIEKNLSSKFTDDNLYLPHFMGEDRAEVALATFKKRPSATASQLFHREAKANPGMFYDRKGRRRVPIDIADFIKRAQNVILSRSGKYHDVEKVARKNSLDFMATGAIPVPSARPGVVEDTFVSLLNSRIAIRKLTQTEERHARASLGTEPEVGRFQAPSP